MSILIDLRSMYDPVCKFMGGEVMGKNGFHIWPRTEIRARAIE
jgi:hypothetical protein